MKYKEKILAVKLRNKGLSYRAILKKIKVSKSTLSIWLREIELTDEQKNKLLNKMEKVRYEIAKRKVDMRKKITKEIIAKAEKETALLKKDPLFFVGLALYWA